jgi:hypothetical protein
MDSVNVVVTVGARIVTIGTIVMAVPRLESEGVGEGAVLGENECSTQAKITNSVRIIPAASQYHHRSLKPDNFIFITSFAGIDNRIALLQSFSTGKTFPVNAIVIPFPGDPVGSA